MSKIKQELDALIERYDEGNMSLRELKREILSLFECSFLETCVSGSRFSGKNNAMVLAMIPELKAGGKVGVIGCKNPKDITECLKTYGIHVQSEPMFATRPMTAIHNLNSIEGEIIGIEYGERDHTGFLFYCT